MGEYGEHVSFVGVAAHDTDEAMDEFRDRHGLTAMTTVVDDDGTLWPHFGVRAQPAWLFVTPDGEVERVLGELSPQQLSDRLDALTAAPGGGG